MLLAGILLVAGCVNSSSATFLTQCMFYGAFINVAGVIVVVSSLALPDVVQGAHVSATDHAVHQRIHMHPSAMWHAFADLRRSLASIAL